MTSAIFYMLHSILLPTSTTKIDDKIKKFSVMESRDAFIAYHKTTLAYVEARNNMAKHKSIPPMINIIGNVLDPTEIFVDFDDITHQFHTLGKAIDSTFKMYYVFLIDYPKPCQSLWIFLNLYFYGLEDGKKPSTSIGALLHQLKSM